MFPTKPVMTRTDQTQFVFDMILSVARDIVGKIESGAIPEYWDGGYLRQYITDKVKERCDAKRFMIPGDYARYIDTVYNNKL